MAAAVSGLSPVIITVRMPISRSRAKRSFTPCFTTSDSSITPSTNGPSATTSGVAPPRAICSTRAFSSAGTLPPSRYAVSCSMRAGTRLVSPTKSATNGVRGAL